MTKSRSERHDRGDAAHRERVGVAALGREAAAEDRGAGAAIAAATCAPIAPPIERMIVLIAARDAGLFLAARPRPTRLAIAANARPMPMPEQDAADGRSRRARRASSASQK